LVSFGFGQAVGKLSGVVKDRETGEPLPGVNVVIQETFLGASTDVDGFFVVLNVPAGTYTVAFDYIGYQPVNVENVRVVVDITKRLDMELQPTAIEIEDAVVVVAERPFFEVAATNTVRVLDSEEIERMPVQGVNSIVAINAGVVVRDGAGDVNNNSGGLTDNATVNVRGGRGNETLVIVDGVPYNDLLMGNVTGTIPDEAIEQVSSQLGGFSAKYGSAQAGVVNLTTKSGGAKFFGGLDAISSEFTDAYNYNAVTGFLGGPIIPGNPKYTFYGTLEYINAGDDTPRSSGLKIPSANIDQKAMPNNESELWRFTGKVDAKLSQFKVTLSANGSFRDSRDYIHRYAKDNSEHFPRWVDDVIGGSVRLSHILNPTTFWDLTFHGKFTDHKRGDGVWFDDIDAYGDSTRNQDELDVTLELGDGDRVRTDENRVFFANGRVSNRWLVYEILTGGADFNFTKQYKNHLLELGVTGERSQVRYYDIGPVEFSQDKDDPTQTEEVRYTKAVRRFYGYDIFGDKIDKTQFRTVEGDRFEEAAPKRPYLLGAYLQDKIEFQDFILNFGLRWDYFDTDTKRLRDPENIFGFGPNPNRLDEEDFEQAPAESYISPRFGFAFPVTLYTVFHAQYGIFRQRPRYFDIYDSWNNIDIIEQRDGQGQNHGHINMEKTTSYEFGFKQQIGNVASLDLTAYYRNVQGLVNLRTERTVFGQTTRTYISKVNQDFGTIKGLAFSFNLRRLGPISTKIDYTLAVSEGTGSDPSSSRVATFRNPDNEVPLAIASLDFDQRHTFTASVDIRANKGEGGKILEDSGVNFLFVLNSGRPYTPLDQVNALNDNTQWGSTTQYVNTANAAGIFRIDLRADKNIRFGKIQLTPYLWIQNLLDLENFNTVWPSTGQPDNTAFLETPEGEELLRSSPEGFESDYRALERDPQNYGLPRIIRLGLKVKF
jgi:outer membrane receptor protein involved in Fe transport